MAAPVSRDVDPFEALDVVADVRRARWCMAIAVLGAPAWSWLWRLTAVQARAIASGHLDPDRILEAAGGPLELFHAIVWLRLHAAVGLAGLHVVFVAGLVALAGVGAWGWALSRRLVRTWGAGRLADMVRGENLAMLSRNHPDVVDRVEAARRSPQPAEGTGSALGDLIRLAALAVRIAPAVSVFATIVLAWLALVG